VFLTTRQAARLSGISHDRICYVLRHHLLDPPPSKTASGEFYWLAEDLERLQSVLSVDRRTRTGQRKEAVL
jgi:hypothetical protein